MKKRIFSFFLAVVMILSLIPAIVISTMAEDNVSYVSNEAQLTAALDAHGTDPSWTIKLTADITLSNNYTAKYVYGTFNGGHHTIYNLTQSSFL